jgi:hypothetical protein
MAVKYFTIYNACIAGVMAGSQAGKLTLLSPSGSGAAVQPADFSSILTSAQAFAVEVDAVLQSAGSSTPANLAALVSEGATVAPTTGSVANAYVSLPTAMAEMAESMWAARTVNGTLDAGGQMANSLAAQFLEFCSGTNNS